MVSTKSNSAFVFFENYLDIHLINLLYNFIFDKKKDIKSILKCDNETYKHNITKNREKMHDI